MKDYSIVNDLSEIKEIQNYIDLVRSGKYATCKEQIQLCDLIEKTFKKEQLYINKEQLRIYMNFQKYFPYDLFEWEIFIFTLHNCIRTEYGKLRWSNLVVYVGRGAGKNGYLAFEDFALITPTNGINEYHIDIFAMAEDQAKTTFEDIYNVLEDNKDVMKKYFKWTKEIITNIKTKSKIRFRTSSPKTKDGGRPGKIDFDEYHAYENMKLVDVATTGLGKKKDSRRTIITTDGDIRGGPLDKLKERSKRVLEQKEPDNGTLFFMCKLDDDEEIKDKKMWYKSNPSLQYLPDLKSQLELEFIDYLEDPLGNSSFATKRMNSPKGKKDVEVTSWENILATNQEINMEDLEGTECIAGIDYAKTTDFVSAGLLFLREGKYIWKTHTWVCAKSSDLKRIKAPIEEWENRGLLTIVNDVEVSPDLVAMWLALQKDNYDIQTLCMDSYRYTLLSRSLREFGFDTDKEGYNNIKLIRPSNEMLIAPTIISAFAKHNIIFGDNPLMRWYTNNSCMITSNAGNTTFGKIEPKSRKTDGFKAFVAAMCESNKLEDSSIVNEIPDIDIHMYP